MKNGKAFHWMEKMDAWGCNYDALKIAESLGITMVVFRDKTEMMWYRADLAKWLASKKFTHFKVWDLQIYLNDYDFIKTKILDLA
jgi:hypothetical protein